jgi:hypothetical protein
MHGKYELIMDWEYKVLYGKEPRAIVEKSVIDVASIKEKN